MSKAKVKKELLLLSKAQLIEQILELYDSYKPVKEFYEFYLNPNEKEAFERCRKKIVQEFYPATKSFEPKLRFREAKAAIAEFATLKPSVELMANLMITLAEMASKFTHDFGDMTEQYYTSCTVNYERALQYMAKEGLLQKFRLRCEACLEYASPCGWGFPDEMSEIFNKYYKS